MTPDRGILANRVSLVVATALTLALFIWLSGWTGTGQPSAAIDAIWVLLTSGPYALAWLAAAVGFGWPLQRWLAPNIEDRVAIQIGLGIAAMLFLDHALGTLGVLQLGGSTVAWAIIATGIALLLVQAVRHQSHIRQVETSKGEIASHLSPVDVSMFRISATLTLMLRCAAVPAVAVLLLATCSAPGALWATEFGGFDALSYHLQLPKEWLAIGRIQPLEHNVYSFLPGYVEAAYYHLAILRGDAIEAAYASQLLHAGFTLLTAWVIGRLVSRHFGAALGRATAVLGLGTPWVIVVGSLAYNEMPTLLMLGVGLIVLYEKNINPTRCGSVIGILAATACGTKLTSLGFVAAPLAAVMLMTVPLRRWLTAICFALASGFIVLLPYLLRNYEHCGNPVFPFATSVFSSAHWNTEQVAIWNRGHLPDLTCTQRFTELWNQVLRFGIDTNPIASEPWKPQWSILPWLAIGGALIGLCAPRTRIAAFRIGTILLIQIVFWMCCTHLKSRFFLPACVPMVIATVIGAAALGVRFPSAKQKLVRIVIGLLLIAWSIQPILVYRTEGHGAPAIAVGQISAFTGDGLSDAQRHDAGASTISAIALNHLLPTDSKVLAIGFATPFYIRTKVVYCTTWDRGSLSMLMQQFPNQPDRWANALREQGFTHLIVDENMLGIWERFGWNDPAMTVANVHDFTTNYASLLYAYPGGVTIHRLMP